MTSLTSKSPRLKAIDRAVGEDGFKVILLLRLSPIFPFALSNYVYGASSVGFAEYFWATVIGFAPGTLGYVYTGTVGKALLDTEGGMGGLQGGLATYALGFVGILGFAKVVGDVATKVVKEIEGMDAEKEDL